MGRRRASRVRPPRRLLEPVASHIPTGPIACAAAVVDDDSDSGRVNDHNDATRAAARGPDSRIRPRP